MMVGAPDKDNGQDQDESLRSRFARALSELAKSRDLLDANQVPYDSSFSCSLKDHEDVLDAHIDGIMQPKVGDGDFGESMSTEDELAHWKRIAEDLRRLIETANAPLFGIDTLGNVTEWNQTTVTQTGFTKEEAMGKNFAQTFVHEDHREAVTEVLQKALRGEESANYELTVFTKTGERRLILLNAMTRRSANGKVVGVVGIGHDITQISDIMAEHKCMADDLSRLIETANAPIFGIDVSGRVNEWNRKAAVMLGYTKEEAMGNDLVESFIQPENQRSVQEVLNKSLDGIESENYELILKSREGKQYTVLLNATTRRDAAGRITGVVGFGQDCTDLITITNEQQRVAEDLSRLIESANAPIFGVDLEGNVTEWNGKAAYIMGWDKGYAMGKHLVNTFIEPEHRSSVLGVLTKAMSGEETANYELPLIAKFGMRFTVLLNATTRRDAKGNVIGVVGVGQDISDLKTVMAESKSVADDLRGLIDTANAPIIGIDTKGNINEWNRKAASLLGFTKTDTMGMLLVDFIDEDSKEPVNAVLSKALRGEETDNFEFPLFSKDNERIDILLNATARRDPNGMITGVIGVGQDITEICHLRAEEKRIADDLSRLIETANAPILGVDLAGLVTDWNVKTSSMLGYSKEDAMGKNLVSNYIQPEHRDSITEVLQKAYSGIETANYELPLISKFGEQYTVLLNATTRCDAKGKVIGVVGVGHDITKLNQVMTESKVLADDLSRLIATANAPIFGIDNHGAVITWNEKTAQITGFSQSEAIGRQLVETFIHPAHRKSVQTVLSKAFEGIETSNYELPLFTKAGERREILLNATTRRNANGDVTGVVGVGQDITELNQQKQEAIRCADDLSRLIQTANAPIFGVDTAGQVTEWNEKLANLVQIGQEEALGKSIYENFVNKECREPLSHVLLKALNGEETASFEFVLAEQNAVLLMSSTTRRGPSGNITGVICVGQDITAMRNITSEWHEVADDLSRLIETANAPIFGVDLAGMVNEWNRKAVDLLGFEKEEAMGKNFIEYFILPNIRDSVEEVLQMALSGIETANYELEVMSKTGTPFSILLNATTRRDRHGKIKGVVGVGQDITALYQVIAESTRVADDLTRLIETANAPIFGIDVNGNVTEWNNMTARISQYTKQEAIGRHLVQKFIPEAYKAKVDKVLQLALHGEEAANFEFPLYTKNDNSQVQILMNATSRRTPAGEIIGVIGVGQDITALRRAKDAADSTADELERLIESANAPIFGVNTGMEVNVWNAMIGKISGVPRGEAMGQNLVESSILDSASRDTVACVLQKALQGTDVANFELHLRRRTAPEENSDFEYAVLLINATARVDGSGRIVGVVGVGQDITEITSYKALEAQKMRFLGMVSHELRSPIHGICGLAQSLAQKESDPNRRKMLVMIQSCSGRLIDLVTNIMDFSRMKANHFRLTVGPSNLVQILQEICVLLEHATDKRGRPVNNKDVRLLNTINPDIPVIQADSARCTQVFYNLVMNALTFTQNGEVRITSSTAEEWVQIRIADTGIGISPYHLDRIFEPFEQEGRKESRSAAFEGLGLGLSICREIVRRHGGDITVQSEVGKGSTFMVTLPRVARIDDSENQSPSLDFLPDVNRSPGKQASDPSEDEQKEFGVLWAQPGEKFKILSVNDAVVNQEVLRQALEASGDDLRLSKLGYEVQTAENSEEALSILSTYEDLPCVVLLEFRPDGGTWELCRSIRQELKLASWRLPIMVICQKSMVSRVLIEGLKSGATDYITRPLNHEELRARMWNLLRVRAHFWNHLLKVTGGKPEAGTENNENSAKDGKEATNQHVSDEAGSSAASLEMQVSAQADTMVTQAEAGAKPNLTNMHEPKPAKYTFGDWRPPHIAERHKHVTILFARIDGWAKIAQVLAAMQALNLITSMFSIFDALLDKKHTYRFDTSCTSYVAVAGHDGDPQHCQRLLALGFALLKEAKRMELPIDSLKFQLRIGIHTGCIDSGRFEQGSSQWRFFGEALDGAEELERSGASSCIHISHAAHEEASLATKKDLLPEGARLVDCVDMDMRCEVLGRTYLIVPAGETDLVLNSSQKSAASPAPSAPPLPILCDTAVQTSESSDAPAKELKADLIEPSAGALEEPQISADSVSAAPASAAPASPGISKTPVRQSSERSDRSARVEDGENGGLALLKRVAHPSDLEEHHEEHEQLEIQMLQSQLLASRKRVAELHQECLKQEEAAVAHQAKLKIAQHDQQQARQRYAEMEQEVLRCRAQLEAQEHKLEHYAISLGLMDGRSYASSKMLRNGS